MERASLCHICGKIASNTCSMCGKRACGRHYDAKTGLCDACKAGRSIK